MDAGDMKGVRELYDPDAVMEVAPDWPEPGPFVGRDAVMLLFGAGDPAEGGKGRLGRIVLT